MFPLGRKSIPHMSLATGMTALMTICGFFKPGLIIQYTLQRLMRWLFFSTISKETYTHSLWSIKMPHFGKIFPKKKTPPWSVGKDTLSILLHRMHMDIMITLE